MTPADRDAIARDLGGEPAAVLADLAEMLDGARRQVPPAGGEG